MQFDWDPEKERRNIKKHGITFKEASKLFVGRSEYLELYDDSHSVDEDRFIAIGPISKGVIVVIYVERDFNTIRLISARKTTRPEIKLFDEFKQGTKG